jgi:hypothetical protein
MLSPTGEKGIAQRVWSPDVGVGDVTETPIERPKRHQQKFYSGKKKRHALKY